MGLIAAVCTLVVWCTSCIGASPIDLLRLEHGFHQLINQIPAPPRGKEYILFNRATCAWSVEDFFERFALGTVVKDNAHPTGYVYRFGTKDSPIWQVTKDIIYWGNTVLYAGDYFYLDLLHKDHFEVFDASLKARTVIDLFGKEDMRKKDEAIRQKRTIKLNIELSS